MDSVFPTSKEKANRIGKLEPLIKAEFPDLGAIFGSEQFMDQGPAVICRFPRALTQLEKDRVAKIINDFDPTLSADEKRDNLTLNESVTAALVEINWSRINNVPPPSWAVNAMNAAHDKISAVT